MLAAVVGLLSSVGAPLIPHSAPAAPAPVRDLYIPPILAGGGAIYAYAQDLRGEIDNPARLVNVPTSTGHSEGPFAVRLTAGGSVLDANGEAVPTVTLESGWNDSTGAWYAHSALHVDPATRSELRFDSHFGSGGVTNAIGAHVAWRPFGEEGPGRSWFVLSGLVQGEHLTPGTDLTALAARVPIDRKRDADAGGVITGATETHRVGEGRVINGTLAFPFEWTKDVTWVDSRGTVGHTWLNGSEWFDGKIPFPIYTEYHGNSQEPSANGVYSLGHIDATTTLLSYHAGSTPIPWGPARPETLSPAPSAAERAASVATGSRWSGHTLEDAMGAAQGDPTLLAFKAWKVANGDARLVGAAFSHDLSENGAADRSVDRWRLVYAAPGGSTTFTLDAVWGAAGALRPSRVVSGGVAALEASQRFEPSDVPSSLITFSQALREWRTFDADGSARGLTRASWGYAIADDPAGEDSGYTIPVEPARMMSTMIVEHADAAKGTESVAPRHAVGLVLDARTGKMQYAYAYQASGRPDVLWYAGYVSYRAVGSPGLPSFFGSTPQQRATVGLVAFLVTLLLYFLPRVHEWSVLLYSRISRANVLDNRLRNELVDLITRAPAVSAPKLRAETKAGWSTVVYHLRRLEKEGVLSSVVDGRHRRYFVVGAMDVASMQRAAVLANESTKRAFEIICARPGIDRATLAGMLGMARPSVTWHVQRLAKVGLVQREVQGTAACFYATDAPRATLDQRT